MRNHRDFLYTSAATFEKIIKYRRKNMQSKIFFGCNFFYLYANVQVLPENSLWVRGEFYE